MRLLCDGTPAGMGPLARWTAVTQEAGPQLCRTTHPRTGPAPGRDGTGPGSGLACGARPAIVARFVMLTPGGRRSAFVRLNLGQAIRGHRRPP